MLVSVHLKIKIFYTIHYYTSVNVYQKRCKTLYLVGWGRGALTNYFQTSLSFVQP